jgi:hypothetical protein
MEEAPENGKELSHSAHGNEMNGRMNEWINEWMNERTLPHFVLSVLGSRNVFSLLSAICFFRYLWDTMAAAHIMFVNS